jgi:acylphosphatase
MTTPAPERREVHYSGRVQGVGFRFTARAVARQYAVTGFVRNLPDGRVQLVAEGQPAEIRAFLDALRAELRAHIREVQETTSPATGHYEGFEIKF